MYVDGNGSHSQRTLAHTLLQSPASNANASAPQLSMVAGGIGGLPPVPEVPAVPLPPAPALPPTPASFAPFTPAEPLLPHAEPSSSGAASAASRAPFRTEYQSSTGRLINCLFIRLGAPSLLHPGALANHMCAAECAAVGSAPTLVDSRCESAASAQLAGGGQPATRLLAHRQCARQLASARVTVGRHGADAAAVLGWGHAAGAAGPARPPSGAFGSPRGLGPLRAART